MWRDFLEAIIAEGVPVKLFATIRATDIVRDAGILHLYRQAGIECVLMGLETTDPATLLKIRKGSTTDDGREAIRLLRAHGILSMAGHIAGFAEERWRDHWNALRQLLLYDPDLLNAMYVTPHRWTEFYRRSQDRELIELDQSKWDYRHQLLGTRYLRPWQLFESVKLTELIMHLRPRVLLRALFYPASIGGAPTGGVCFARAGCAARADGIPSTPWPSASKAEPRRSLGRGKPPVAISRRSLNGAKIPPAQCSRR